MFDDPKKELEELQKQLLQNEEWFETELDSAKRMIGQQPVKTRTAAPKKNKKTEAKAAPAPKKKGVKGLLILAGLETLGILAVAAYWVLFLLR